ncbi:hypothetical protein [Hyalangium versicolor]|uniref:hypothetical protein n=1 Tax=Hyalangium versicolor TaxID=2861190 RepID=UPI001CC91DA9|nr:hypothetical protein [Hyalangium versicolor]
MWQEYFLNRIRGALGEHLGEMPEQAFTAMVASWIYDVTGNQADEWWEILDSLPGSMEGQIQRFVDEMSGCFIENLEFLERYDELGPMIEDLRRRYTDGGWNATKLRFQENPHYAFFVRHVQRELVLTVPLLCLLGGEMSGDMFGIGATMSLNPDARVLIMRGTDLALDHTGDIEGFLKTCDPTRVYVSTKDKKAKNLKITEIFKTAREIFLPMPYYLGTLYLSIQGYWKDTQARSWIREDWGVSDTGGFWNQCPTLVSWLVDTGLPFEEMKGEKVLVLWSRFTGKKGEIHVEHDTSFTGVEQLALEALGLGYYVIITGDPPVVHLEAKEGRARKFDVICEKLNASFKSPRIFNLTNFWKKGSWEGTFGKGRIHQFRLYELLHRACDTRHLGMRSGNLEAMALMGFCVRYMEEVNSQGGERMSAWHSIGLGYERILLKRPPTRTGQWVIQQYQGKTYPKKINWIAARNQGVQGTIGDPSKVKAKAKPQNERSKKKVESRSNVNDEVPSVDFLPDMELEPKKKEDEKPSLDGLKSGFAKTDRAQVREFLASQNRCPVFETLPVNWRSQLI